MSRDVSWSISDRPQRAAARGAAPLAISTGARFLMQFGTAVFVARLIGPVEYGFAAVLIVLTAIAELIRNSGLSHAVIHNRGLTSRIASSVHYSNAIGGAIVATLLVCVAPALAVAFSDPRYARYSWVVALALVTAGFSAIPAAVLARNLAFRRLAIIETLASVVASSAAIAIAIAGWGAGALAWQAAIWSTTMWLALIIGCPWRPGRGCALVELGPYLRFGFHASLAQMSRFGALNVDKVALGLFSNPAQTGVYSQANQLVVVPSAQLIAPLQRIAPPLLSRLPDPAAYRRAYRILAATTAYALFPLAGFLIVGAASLIEVLYGPEWSAAAPVLQILCVLGVTNVVVYLNSWVFVSTGQVGRQSVHMMAMAALSIPGVIVSALHGGSVLVASAVGTASLVSAVTGFIVSRTGGGLSARDLIPELLWPAALAMTATGATAILFQQLHVEPMSALVWGGVCHVALYAGLVCAVPHPRRSLRTIVRQFTKGALGAAEVPASSPNTGDPT